MARTPDFDLRKDYTQNYLINGNFDFWQRGSSGLLLNSANVRYRADRWGTSNGYIGVHSRQAFSSGGVHPGNSNYVLRCAGDGATSMRLATCQATESVVCRPLLGKKVTLSGYIRFSAASLQAATAGSFGIYVGGNYSSFDGNSWSTDYLASSSVGTIYTNGSLPTAWTKFSVTYTSYASLSNLGVRFNFSNAAVFGASEYYELSQVMLCESNDDSVIFRPAGGSYINESMLCQRYFEKSYPLETVPGTAGRVGSMQHVIQNTYYFSRATFFKVTKRAASAVTLYATDGTISAGTWTETTGPSDTFSANRIGAVTNSGVNSFEPYLLGGGAVVGSWSRFHFTSDAEL